MKERNINKSIIADRGGRIEKVKQDNRIINTHNWYKQPFWGGFVGGVVSSLIATIIWYFLMN